MIRIIWVYLNVLFYVLFNFISIRKRYKHPEKYSIDERHKYILKLCNIVVKKSGLKVIIEGRENIPDEPVLYASNHSSMIDPYFVGHAINKQLGAVIAGDLWFERVPVIAPWFKSIGCVFVDRKNPRKGIKGINQAIENMKKGHSMLLFPEGEITKIISHESVGPFHTGGMKIALKAKKPIIPMAIIGSEKVYEAHEVFGKLKKGTIIIKILKPYTKHLTDNIDVKVVTDEVKKLIKYEVDNTEIPS